MKKSITYLLTVCLFLIGSQSFGQNQQDSLKVLFVGNSYTYFENLAQITSLISEDTKIKLITQKSTVGGAKLSEHWHQKRGLKTKEIIENGDYDIVVLQGHSMSTINEPDSLRKYAKLFSELIKEKSAKPYLYLTWARKRVPQYQETINRVYTEIAASNNATIVPAGKAWALSQRLRPNHELFYTDGTHPSKHGTFLTACIFVATISGELPENLKSTYMSKDFRGEPIELMRINGLDMVFTRKITEKIVFDK